MGLALGVLESAPRTQDAFYIEFRILQGSLEPLELLGDRTRRRVACERLLLGSLRPL